jgi:glycosyltransferase involved in cell wall biosynthesis
MTEKNRVLAIIPAYREEKNISGIVRSLKADGFDVLVVDDASPDGTARAAEAGGGVVVSHPFNLRYAVALQTGYKYALFKGYEAVVQLDGDGQHNPEDAIKLVRVLEEEAADIVIGSRFLAPEKYAMQKARLLGKTLFAYCVFLCTGKRITDPTSGYQALSRKAVELYAADVFSDEYPDADMLIMAMRSGCKVVEVGVAMRHNDTGQSMHSGFIAPLYYVIRMSLGVLAALLSRQEK